MHETHTNSVCITCAGGSLLSLGNRSSVGHAISVELYALLTQQVLSIKHSDVNTLSSYKLSRSSKDLFSVDSESAYIRLIRNKINEVPIMIGFNSNDVPLLNDIYLDVIDIDKIDETTWSNIVTIDIYYKSENDGDPNNQTTDGIRKINFANNQASMVHFSRDFIWYLYNNKDCIETKPKGKNVNFIVDLRKIDSVFKMFKIPGQNYSMLDYHRQVTTMFESTVSTEGRKLTDYKLFGEASHVAMKLLCSKFPKLTLTTIELNMFAYTNKDPDNGDFNLGCTNGEGNFRPLSTLFRNRSFGGNAMYHSKFKIYIDVNSYAIDNAYNTPNTLYDTNFTGVDYGRLGWLHSRDGM